MKSINKLILYVFLIVISNPYQGIDYDKVNVYDVNYCTNYCANQNNSSWDYLEEEEIEQVKWEKEDKPLKFDLDFWDEDK